MLKKSSIIKSMVELILIAVVDRDNKVDENSSSRIFQKNS